MRKPLASKEIITKVYLGLSKPDLDESFVQRTLLTQNYMICIFHLQTGECQRGWARQAYPKKLMIQVEPKVDQSPCLQSLLCIRYGSLSTDVFIN